jgi:hypothetical protein
MKGMIVAVALAAGTGCTRDRHGPDFEVSQVAPVELRTEAADGSTPGLWLIAAADDCFGCRLEAGFLALRSMQRADNALPAPKITVFLVGQAPSDTIAFSAILRSERITARIVLVSLRTARRHLHPRKMPAIYWVWGGRVLGKWENTGLRQLVVGRNDIRDAMSRTAGEHGGQ